MKTQENIRCYRIIRTFRDDRKARTIKNGLTLAEAQAHCKRPDTMKKGEWADGYSLMKGVRS